MPPIDRRRGNARAKPVPRRVAASVPLVGGTLRRTRPTRQPRRVALSARPYAPSSPRTTEKRSSPAVREFRARRRMAGALPLVGGALAPPARPRVQFRRGSLSLAQITAANAYSQAARRGDPGLGPRLRLPNGQRATGSPDRLLAGYLAVPGSTFEPGRYPRGYRTGLEVQASQTPSGSAIGQLVRRQMHEQPGMPVGPEMIGTALAQAGEAAAGGVKHLLDQAFGKPGGKKTTGQGISSLAAQILNPAAAATMTTKVGRNALSDAINIPAQAPISIYQTGQAALEAAQHPFHPADWKKAQKLWDAYKATGVLPALASGDLGQAFKRAQAHPVAAAMELRGGEALIAKGLRGGLIAATKARGRPFRSEYFNPRTSRRVEIVPGLAPRANVRYSRDPFAKAVQVGIERRRVAADEHPLPRRPYESRRAATQRHIRNAIDADVDANDVFRRANALQLGKVVKRALKGDRGPFRRTAKFMGGSDHVAYLLLEGRIPLTSEAAARAKLTEIRDRLATERASMPPGERATTNERVRQEIDAALHHPTVLRDLPRISEALRPAADALNRLDHEMMAQGFLPPPRAKAKFAPAAVEHLGAREAGAGERVLTDIGRVRQVLAQERGAAAGGSRVAQRQLRDAIAADARTAGETIGRKGALREAGMTEEQAAARLHERTVEALSRAHARRASLQRKLDDPALTSREQRFVGHQLSRVHDRIDRLEQRVSAHEGRRFAAADAAAHRLALDRVRRAEKALRDVRALDPSTPDGAAHAADLRTQAADAERHAQALTDRAAEVRARTADSHSELTDYSRAHADQLEAAAARAGEQARALSDRAREAADPIAHAERVHAAEQKAISAAEVARESESAQHARALGEEIQARDTARAELRAAREQAKAARAAEQEARKAERSHRAAYRGRPLTRKPWLVTPDGKEIAVSDVKAALRDQGIDPDGVAFLSQQPRMTQAAAHYQTRAKPSVAGGARQRTGSATRQGAYDISLNALMDRIAARGTVKDLLAGTDRVFKEWTFGEFDSPQKARSAIEALTHEAVDSEGNTLTFNGDGYMRPDGSAVDPGEIRTFVRPWARKTKNSQEQDLLSVVNLSALYSKLKEVETIRQRLEVQDFHGVARQLSDAIHEGVVNPRPTGKGDRWAVIPTDAADWIAEHMASAKTTGDMRKVWQAFTHQFRQTVLLTSTKWFTGNLVEMVLRTLLMHGIGPRAHRTGRKIMKEVERQEAAGEMAPGLANLFRAQFQGGANIGTLERYHLRRGPKQFKGAGLQRTAEVAWALREGKWSPTGPYALGGAWHVYKALIRGLNERIEKGGQLAALGHVARKDYREWGDRWVAAITLSEKAYADLARGLTDTSTQRRYAREVDRIIGQYSKFTPTMRRLIQGNGLVPFAAWAINAAKFVYQTLPVSHPLKTALLAAVYEGDAERLRKLGFDAYDALTSGGGVGIHNQGGLLRPDGRVIPVAHYTPFAIASEGIYGVGDFLVPQIGVVTAGLAGKDFAGRDLTNAQGQKIAGIQALPDIMYGLASQLVPGLALVQHVLESGGDTHPASRAWDPLVRGKTKAEGGPGRAVAVQPTGTIWQGLDKTFNPFYPRKTARSKAQDALPGGVPQDIIDQVTTPQGGGVPQSVIDDVLAGR